MSPSPAQQYIVATSVFSQPDWDSQKSSVVHPLSPTEPVVTSRNPAPATFSRNPCGAGSFSGPSGQSYVDPQESPARASEAGDLPRAHLRSPHLAELLGLPAEDGLLPSCTFPPDQSSRQLNAYVPFYRASPVLSLADQSLKSLNTNVPFHRATWLSCDLLYYWSGQIVISAPPIKEVAYQHRSMPEAIETMGISNVRQ